MSITPQRTHGQAVAEVRFGVEYAALNERYWQRLDTAFGVVQVLAGALALAGLLGSVTWLMPLGSGAVAVVSALQITLTPVRRSIAFRDARYAFHALAKRAWGLPLADLDAELEDLRRTAPAGSTLLLRPAQNIVEQQHGHAPAHRLSWLERCALALA